MKIGWWVGPDKDWAFLHFARSVQSKVPEHTHLFNEQGDVNIVASLAFLPKLNSYENYITRISGHRIFTNYGVHFNFLESLTIGWWVGDTQWAFRYLAEHIQEAVPEHNHVENTTGDVNIVLDPVTLMAHSVDTSYIMHLDGNRFFEDRGVYFDNRVKVIHLIWAKGAWSWGVVYTAIENLLSDRYDFDSIEFKSFREYSSVLFADSFYFCQNITQVAYVPVPYRCNTIVRLGGNMNFEGTGSEAVDNFMLQMSKCGAVIATNRKLYRIGLRANPNTYLIPNGIDTDVWCPSYRRFNDATPTVGFIGNVTTPEKAKYKGYDIVTRACQEMGLPLKQALYRHQQIPHKKMKLMFWDKIDIFVLPTDGEGCSNSIMESLSCGVPVITTRTAGYHGETLTDQHNVVFIEKTVADIKRALKQFIHNPEFHAKISKNGREFAIEHHGVKKIAGMYREVFEKHFNRKEADPEPVEMVENIEVSG